MIKFSKHFIIIYIDHEVNSIIVAAIKLFTSSIDRLNMKLIKALTYLSQFRLDIRYRSEKFNIISDALSRLLVTKNINSQKALNVDVDLEHFQLDMNSSENDQIYVYATILVEMFNDFKFKIQQRYREKQK